MEDDRTQNWRRALQRMMNDPEGRRIITAETGVYIYNPDDTKIAHVAILVPSNRQPEPLAMNSWDAMREHARKTIDVGRSRIGGHSVIHWTRNELISALYKQNINFTHVLFIDDDMDVEPDTCDKLLSHGKDIVAGLCTVRTDPPLPVMKNFNETTGDFTTRLTWPNGGGLVETDAVGTGVMLISRKALEAVGDFYLNCGYERHMGFDAAACDKWAAKRKAGFEVASNDRFYKNGMWFDFLYALSGQGQYGEDMSFCLKAKLCGIQTYVDTSVHPKHIGKYGFSIQDFFYYKQELILKAKARGEYVEQPEVTIAQ